MSDQQPEKTELDEIPTTKPEVLLYMYRKETDDLARLNLFISHICEPTIVYFRNHIDTIEKYPTVVDMFKYFGPTKELREQLIEQLEDNTRSQNINGPVGNWVLLVPKFIHDFLLFYHHYTLFPEEMNGLLKELPELRTRLKQAEDTFGQTVDNILHYFVRYPRELLKRITAIHKATEPTHADFKKLDGVINNINIGLQKIEAAKTDGIPNKIETFTIVLRDQISTYGRYVNVTDGQKEKTKGLVISKISRNSREKIIQIHAEIEANQILKHRNILRMSQFYEDELFWYMFWPDIEDNSLKALLSHGKLIEEAARPIFRQMMLGLQHVHSSDIVHTNVTPENIVFYRNVVRIRDFQSCVFAGRDEFVHIHSRPSPYSAPESFGKVPYCGARADIWSCGIILFEMLAGRPPFSASSTELLAQRIKRGNLIFPKSFSSSLIGLLKGILTVVPHERFTIEQILSHAWMLKLEEVSISQLLAVH